MILRRVTNVPCPLDARELGVVLAGLRALQVTMSSGHGALPAPLAGIASDGGSLRPLSPEEIDGLAERLNAQGR